MKRLFTLLMIAMVVTVSFAQPPIKVAYIGDADPAAAGDLLMPEYLEALGFDLTYFAMGVDNPVADYDVVVCSEVPGSSNGGWAAYATAPLPIVHFKVHALKTAALNWVATGAGVTGTDYDNSTDSTIVIIDDQHPIATGYTGEVQVTDNSAANEANVGWVNMPEGNGIKVVGQSGAAEATHQAIVAIDAGTVLNPTVTLVSRAVIVGYHQACWATLNDDGKELLKNAIYWAASRDLPVVDGISTTSAIEASVYPNPSTGIVNVRFSEISSEISVNVLSMDGRVVFTQQLANQSSSIDLSELNSGMYFINFEGADISYTEKLILK